jgi:hypothetical protein
VLVAYKVSEWLAQQTIEVGCLVAKLVGDESAPSQSCAKGFETFSMIPNHEGIYEISVALVTSDGRAFNSQTVALNVTMFAPLSATEYRRREGFRTIYEFGHWGEDGGRSGHGSSVAGAASDSQFLTRFLEM